MNVPRIKELYAEGRSVQYICDLFSMNRYSVRKIIGKLRSPADANFARNQLDRDPLSESQEQLILGSLLGDASIIASGPNKRSLRFQVSHCEKQYEYIAYKASLFGVNILTEKTRSGFGSSQQMKIKFFHPPELKRIASIAYKDGVKRVTKEWLELLNPEGIAFWFMDDGSSSYGSNPGRTVTAAIATMGFDEEENVMIRDHFQSIGIDARISKYRKGSGFQVFFSVKGSQDLMTLIHPHVEKVPSMLYKIKLKERSISQE